MSRAPLTPRRPAPARAGALAAALCVALWAALAAAPHALRAQTQPPPDTVTIPDVPAFVLLNAAPSDIQRPTTTRELTVGLSNVIDSLGRARQGVAVAFQPWFVFGAPVTREKYRTSRWWYSLANLDVSAGSARSAGADTTSTDVALGAKTVFFNRSDLLGRADVDSAVKQLATGECNRELYRDTVSRLVDEVRRAKECLVPKTNAIYKAAAKQYGALSAAFAVGGRLPESRIGALRYTGVSTWLTAELPTLRTVPLLVQARYDHRTDADSATNVLSSGVRLVRTSGRVNAFAEMLGRWADRGQDRSTAKWSAGVEFPAVQQLWLAVGFGSTFATRYEKDQVHLLANLRWALADRPRLR